MRKKKRLEEKPQRLGYITPERLMSKLVYRLLFHIFCSLSSFSHSHLSLWIGLVFGFDTQYSLNWRYACARDVGLFFKWHQLKLLIACSSSCYEPWLSLMKSSSFNLDMCCDCLINSRIFSYWKTNFPSALMQIIKLRRINIVCQYRTVQMPSLIRGFF